MVLGIDEEKCSYILSHLFLSSEDDSPSETTRGCEAVNPSSAASLFFVVFLVINFLLVYFLTLLGFN